MLSVNYLLFSVVTVLNKGLSLSLGSLFECVSVEIGSDKHSAYLYPFNYPFEFCNNSIQDCMFFNNNFILKFIRNFNYYLGVLVFIRDSNWLQGERIKL